jgi:hypothetical protein
MIDKSSRKLYEIQIPTSLECGSSPIHSRVLLDRTRFSNRTKNPSLITLI